MPQPTTIAITATLLTHIVMCACDEYVCTCYSLKYAGRLLFQWSTTGVANVF